MQTNKEIVKEMFDSANAIHKVSRTGNLYGKLFAIKDMQIYLLKEEKLINEEIERCKGLEKRKERKKDE